MTTYYFIDGFLFEPEHLSYIESTSVQKDKKSLMEKQASDRTRDTKTL